MRQPHVNDHVRLTQDIPELELSRGDIGIVRSTWFAPHMAYEVEFNAIGLSGETRALLLEEQLQVQDATAVAESQSTMDERTRIY